MLMPAQLGSFFLQLYLYLVPCRLSLIDRSASETCRQQGRFGTRGQGAWRPFLGYGELYLIARGNAVVFNEWPICRRAARQVCATPSGTRAATIRLTQLMHQLSIPRVSIPHPRSSKGIRVEFSSWTRCTKNLVDGARCLGQPRL